MCTQFANRAQEETTKTTAKLHLCAGSLNIKSSPSQITISCDPETIFAPPLYCARLMLARAWVCNCESELEIAHGSARRNNAKDAFGECVIIACCSTRGFRSGGGVSNPGAHIPTRRSQVICMLSGLRGQRARRGA